MSGEDFKNRAEALRWLEDQGYQVTKTTFYDHVKIGDGIKLNKDGKTLSRKAVEAYAKAKFTQAVKQREEDAGAQTAKAAAQADNYAVDAELKRLKLAQMQGKLIEKALVDDMMAARARVFRVGLEGFAPKLAGRIAELFGAGEAAARRLVEAAGGDMERIEQVQAVAESLQPDLLSLCGREVEAFLEPYSNGTWWTEELAQALAEVEQEA